MLKYVNQKCKQAWIAFAGDIKMKKMFRSSIFLPDFWPKRFEQKKVVGEIKMLILKKNVKYSEENVFGFKNF